MTQAKKGDRVTINFVGTMEDGSVFDSTLEIIDTNSCGTDDCGSGNCGSGNCGSSCGCDDEVGPMELVIGEGEFLGQIEEALIGMTPGEKKSVNIPSEDTFGDYDEEMVFEISRSDIPDDLYPEVGQELELTGEDDEVLEVTVVDVSDETVTLDSNHPLAGEDLTYEVELVEIL